MPTVTGMLLSVALGFPIAAGSQPAAINKSYTLQTATHYLRLQTLVCTNWWQCSGQLMCLGDVLPHKFVQTLEAPTNIAHSTAAKTAEVQESDGSLQPKASMVKQPKVWNTALHLLVTSRHKVTN